MHEPIMLQLNYETFMTTEYSLLDAITWFCTFVTQSIGLTLLCVRNGPKLIHGGA